MGTDFVSALAAGGTSTETITLNAPDDEDTYYYGATVDAVTGESDTGNNASSALTVVVTADTAPDLTIDTPTRSPTGNLTPGEQFVLSAVVRNSGNDSSLSTTLRWRRSTNPTISTLDPQVGSDSVSALSAGGTSTVLVKPLL